MGGPPVELSADPAFGRRVRRLALTSAVVLGLVAGLATVTVPGRLWIHATLVGGWLLMPAILWLSLRHPLVRYGLIAPAFLVSVGLLAICFIAPAPHPLALAGWWLVAAGVLLGGILGIWFWFRWLPVPPTLTQPFSRGRWTLIAIHVGLVVMGLVLVSIAVTE